MSADSAATGLYRKPLSLDTAAALRALEAKARSPKKVRKAAARKAAPVRATSKQQLDAHVTSARPFLIPRAASISLGHDPLPLSYFASASQGLIADDCRCEHCHPSVAPSPAPGPQSWGIRADTGEATSMGPGLRAPGVRIA